MLRRLRSQFGALRGAGESTRTAIRILWHTEVVLPYLPHRRHELHEDGNLDPAVWYWRTKQVWPRRRDDNAPSA